MKTKTIQEIELYEKLELIKFSLPYAKIDLIREYLIKATLSQRQECYKEFIEKIDSKSFNVKLIRIIMSWVEDYELNTSFDNDFDLKERIKGLLKQSYEQEIENGW